MNRIGLDLDNTIIDYSRPAREYAKQKNIQNISNLQDLRLQLKQKSNPDEWIQAQSWIYTEGLKVADVAKGFNEFIDYTKLMNKKVFVISHKSEFAAWPSKGNSLREPAIYWLEKNLSFVDLVLNQNLFFEDSQEAKIRKIVELKCNVFVDDLPEILQSNQLPSEIYKILIGRTKHKEIIGVENFFDLEYLLRNWSEDE
jgi:hypothetical protein